MELKAYSSFGQTVLLVFVVAQLWTSARGLSNWIRSCRPVCDVMGRQALLLG